MLIFFLLVMLALLVLNVPIYLGLFVGVILITLFVIQIDPMIMTAIMFNQVDKFVLLAVPLFLMAGYFLAYGGTAKALLDFLNSFMRHIPGGPAYVIIVGCVVFAAMSSSAIAAVAGFAPIMLPMMAEMGYDRKFSMGLLICSATLGPMIPPSLLLIMYGVIAEQSIRDLFTAAFLPGLMVAGLLFATVLFWSFRGSYTRQPAASWGERWRAIQKGWPVLIMPPVVMAPIYLGLVTPTEAGAVCAIYSFFLGAIVYRGLKLPQIWLSLTSSVRVCAMIFLIIMAAFLLNWTLVYVRLPFEIAEGIADMGLSAPFFLLVTISLYIIMGMFLDPMAILLVSVVLLMPTVHSLDIHPIAYGILVVKIVGLATITPPYGMLLFVASSILKEPFHIVVRGCLMFYPAMLISLFLIAYVPQISLWLPHFLH
jgi:C4-dicarboxylate transporter DctM subunit